MTVIPARDWTTAFITALIFIQTLFPSGVLVGNLTMVTSTSDIIASVTIWHESGEAGQVISLPAARVWLGRCEVGSTIEVELLSGDRVESPLPCPSVVVVDAGGLTLR